MKPLIFCSKCNYCNDQYWGDYHCDNNPKTTITPIDIYTIRELCNTKNKNNDCKEFQPKEKQFSWPNILCILYSLAITTVIILIVLKLLNYE